MDRFVWHSGSLAPEERDICQQSGVRLYDGDDKTSFDSGKATLTTHQLLWKDHKDQNCIIALPLSYVVCADEQSGTRTKSPKIVLHLNPAQSGRASGPIQTSSYTFVRLSFKDGGNKEFYGKLCNELSKKSWDVPAASSTGPSAVGSHAAQQRQFRSGIGGIEKHRQQKHKQTDENISQAFEDLSKLMDKAKEMVILSKNVSQRIKDKQGDITEDETIKFKSYLLSLGISDPVTRETHGTGSKYYSELAKQISDVMQDPLKECGGMMTLTDVYCRINRARGMELLSPEDLVNACKLMETLNLPVRFRAFESGVKVLQLLSHSEAQAIKDTEETVRQKGSATAEELSRVVGLSVLLAKERLLASERAGKLCRDDSSEGLRFYPNMFLTPPTR